MHAVEAYIECLLYWSSLSIFDVKEILIATNRILFSYLISSKEVEDLEGLDVKLGAMLLRMKVVNSALYSKVCESVITTVKDKVNDWSSKSHSKAEVFMSSAWCNRLINLMKKGLDDKVVEEICVHVLSVMYMMDNSLLYSDDRLGYVAIIHTASVICRVVDDHSAIVNELLANHYDEFTLQVHNDMYLVLYNIKRCFIVMCSGVRLSCSLSQREEPQVFICFLTDDCRYFVTLT